MKKTFYLSIVVCLCTMFSSCGAGSISKPSTGNATSSELGGSLGAALGVLGDLLEGKTTQNSIVGTWVYSEPKVVFESENMLAKIGASVASNKVESTLVAQLSKFGFTEGKTRLILNQDSTCVLRLGSKDVSGTYTYDTKTNKLTITGAFGVKSVSCTATIKSGELYMLYEADSLLGIAQNLSKVSATTSTLSTILKNYNGLKLGWSMRKE